VHDDFNLVAGEHALKLLSIEEFALNEFRARNNALPVSFAQVVLNDGGMFLREQFLHHNAADVTSTACYEDMHESSTPFFR
jgi:hypothetical protein